MLVPDARHVQSGDLHYYKKQRRLVPPAAGCLPPATTMKIYTKTGDLGETGLFAGPRVKKDDCRIEAYGTVDELNAVLGLAQAAKLPSEIGELVAAIQHRLFDLGARVGNARSEVAGHAIDFRRGR